MRTVIPRANGSSSILTGHPAPGGRRPVRPRHGMTVGAVGHHTEQVRHDALMATRETIHDVIELFRQAPSNVERGTKFENLMVAWFRTDPVLAAQYDEVCTWPLWSRSAHVSLDLCHRGRQDQARTVPSCRRGAELLHAERQLDA